MASPKVLITGATGYIGGSVITTILNSSNPSLQNIQISALVRRQEQAEVLTTLGITPILFTNLDDSEFLTQTASNFDIVIHAANGYHTASAKALIQGLAERKAKTGKPVHYIHNSGTSNVADRPISGANLGETPRIFSDKEDIYTYEKAREEKSPYQQRTTDITVFETGAQTGVPTYIICSPLIYGQGTGLFNKSSIQIPLLIKAAIARGEAIYVGNGLGIWDHTHIEDIAEFYTLTLSKVLTGENIPSGKDGFYFVNGGKQTWLDIAKSIAKAGSQLGKIAVEPRSVTLAEASREWFDGDEQLTELALCSRSVTVGEKSRELGWKPQKDDSRWEETFTEEFKAALKSEV
ncbi:hypothetical protein FSARC_4977 [Fusarium sarcochroum]|uniref:NAD-dependent epimerase/dehydratase domain-containing protein n=1 Tax=Fusarium sarcochroum TaxID=1208366 RepID=A0A8H4U0H0_9HYPO|nr:hypothetical protein FSARC_4977 [Fusarium sarcochroum]